MVSPWSSGEGLPSTPLLRFSSWGRIFPSTQEPQPTLHCLRTDLPVYSSLNRNSYGWSIFVKGDGEIRPIHQIRFGGLARTGNRKIKRHKLKFTTPYFIVTIFCFDLQRIGVVQMDSSMQCTRHFLGTPSFAIRCLPIHRSKGRPFAIMCLPIHRMACMDYRTRHDLRT